MSTYPAIYLDQCWAHGGGDRNRARWAALGEMLNGRNGWTFRVADTGVQQTAMWTYGQAGAGRIVITIETEIIVYIAELDEQLSFRSIDQFAAWLPVGERALVGLSPMQVEILKSEAVRDRMPPE